MIIQTNLAGSATIVIPWPIKVSVNGALDALTKTHRAMLKQGCTQGYLSTEQVRTYFPDAPLEDGDPTLVLLQEHGIAVTDEVVAEVWKTCPACGELKLLKRFMARQYSYANLWTNCCEGCRLTASSRDDHLRRTYWIDYRHYLDLLVTQGGVCAICGTRPEEVLAVDHCHESEKVRGLLCSRCNLGIGHFKDDVARLRAAAVYLERGCTRPPA